MFDPLSDKKAIVICQRMEHRKKAGSTKIYNEYAGTILWGDEIYRGHFRKYARK